MVKIEISAITYDGQGQDDVRFVGLGGQDVTFWIHALLTLEAKARQGPRMDHPFIAHPMDPTACGFCGWGEVVHR